MLNLWFDVRNISDHDIILSKVYNLNYNGLILTPELLDKLNIKKSVDIILDIGSNENYENKDNFILFSYDEKILLEYSKKGSKTAYFKTISSKEEMEKSCEIGENFDYFIIEFSDETNIPLEYILAKFQNKNTKVIKIISNTREAAVASGVMQIGSFGIVLNSNDLNEIISLNNLIESKKINNIEIVTLEVTDVKHLGMGHRACIDTTTIMSSNEGMIIGSTSSGGLLVCSETHELEYLDLRPFRVNAGSIHSYVWSKNNSTPYLSELKSGSEVMCVDSDGKTRITFVGRIKIEIRPLVKIEAKYNDTIINTIVQDDWNIRIIGTEDKTLNSSNIKVGDKVLGHICNPGRHAGIQIDEYIKEI